MKLADRIAQAKVQAELAEAHASIFGADYDPMDDLPIVNDEPDGVFTIEMRRKQLRAREIMQGWTETMDKELHDEYFAILDSEYMGSTMNILKGFLSPKESQWERAKHEVYIKNDIHLF